MLLVFDYLLAVTGELGLPLVFRHGFFLAKLDSLLNIWAVFVICYELAISFKDPCLTVSPGLIEVPGE